MVSSVQVAATSDTIPISKPDNDARHNTNFIKTASVTIKGHATDFIAQPFTDRIFIIVTQFEKMGTMLSAEQELPLGGPESFHVKTLMGKRDIPELELCARQVISLMAVDGCLKPLLMSLALKDHSMETISAIVDKMKDLRVW